MTAEEYLVNRVIKIEAENEDLKHLSKELEIIINDVVRVLAKAEYSGPDDFKKHISLLIWDDDPEYEILDKLITCFSKALQEEEDDE